MTFEEHLENHRGEDGLYDLVAAERALAEELSEDTGKLAAFAAKAAHQDRLVWEKRQREALQKQLVQPALSPELELDIKVQIGSSSVVELGDMNLERIRFRRDLRTRLHLGEIKSFENEMRHWFETEDLLEPDETISVAVSRLVGEVSA